MQSITLGGGCFWCIEAVFQEIRGVESVISGYAGGHVKNPTYNQVTTGTTGHAEVCQVEFDPAVISLEDILDVFFSAHDPTTLNRQGNDYGPQYRSIILYHTPEQKEIAENAIQRLQGQRIWKKPIVTEVVQLDTFYRAEDYHQNYYRNNPNAGYCRIVIRPKLKKVEKVFKLKLK